MISCWFLMTLSQVRAGGYCFDNCSYSEVGIVLCFLNSLNFYHLIHIKESRIEFSLLTPLFRAHLIPFLLIFHNVSSLLGIL